MEINIHNAFVPVYFPYLKNESRYLVLYGGGGSGKSYFAAEKVVYRIVSEKGHRILVVRKVAKTMRASVFTLMKEIIGNWGLSGLFVVNKSEMTLKCTENGNEILFVGMDDPEKIKSIQGITSIWIEEATELTKEDFLQLNIRLRGYTNNYKQIMLSFNPISAMHWVYNHFFASKDRHILNNASILKTTYKDNTKLDPEYAMVLEGLMEQDRNYYEIYAKGEWGLLLELIYRPFPIVNSYPEFFSETIYGLDFGFVNPTALIKIDIKDSEYYTTELIYQSKLTNQDLIEKLIDLNINKNHPIYADHAEPQRIEEISRAGFNIYSADKSVKDGIDHVKRRRIYSRPENININKEVRAYSYKKDKDGNILEEPVKFLDHTLDAIRYGIHSHHKYLEGVTTMDVEEMDDEHLKKICQKFMNEKYKLTQAETPENDILPILSDRLNLPMKQLVKLAEFVKENHNY